MDVLIFALMRTGSDVDTFSKDLRQFVKHNPMANVYLIMIGPTNKSPTNGLYHNSKLVYSYKCESNTEQMYYKYLEIMIKKIQIKKFKHLFFYGHSDGFTLGGRVNTSSPMIEFSKFSKLLHKYRFFFEVIFFEGCYFATVSGIIEFYKFAKYIIGSTGYYSGHCFMSLIDIGKPLTKQYLLGLRRAYYSQNIPKYSCINIYKCKYIPYLVQYIKNDLDLSLLDFKKENQHTKSDRNSFIFGKADKSLRLKKILNMILVNKNTPCDISIECCIYEKSYRNTKYFKILNHKNKQFLQNAAVH